jgi:pSer/pThr/pTyr-binding forkhead associated (FHA) protein
MNHTKTFWIIGADPASDIVIDRPSVSWRHARLVRLDDLTFVLEDLGSTNGSFVNGLEVKKPTRVSRKDRITLGLSIPLELPEPGHDPEAGAVGPPGTVVLTVGREPGNDVVIDRPEISARHARIVIAPGGRKAVIEDLGSTNGIAVNTPGNVVSRAPLAPGDVIYFGPVSVPATTFFGSSPSIETAVLPELVVRGETMTVGRDPECDHVLDYPMISGRHARFTRSKEGITVEDLQSSNGTFVNGVRVAGRTPVKGGDLIGFGSYSLRLAGSTVEERSELLSAWNQLAPSASWSVPPVAAGAVVSRRVRLAAGVMLGAQIPLLAELIQLTRREPAGVAFGLAIAALWIGLASALLERLIDRSHLEHSLTLTSAVAGTARAFARPLLIDLVLTSALLGLVVRITPSRPSVEWSQIAVLGLLWLSALVGSALGLAIARLAIARLATGRIAGLLAALLLTAVMGAYAGYLRPLPRIGGVERGAIALNPARWSFEALWTLATRGAAGDDPVERFFPSASDRAGVAASTLALMAMLGGLLYADLLASLCLTVAGRRPVGSRPW